MNAPCALCGYGIAVSDTGSKAWFHANCEKRDKEMPKYRFRVTWRGKLILQRRGRSFTYTDCRINEDPEAITALRA